MSARPGTPQSGRQAPGAPSTVPKTPAASGMFAEADTRTPRTTRKQPVPAGSGHNPRPYVTIREPEHPHKIPFWGASS